MSGFGDFDDDDAYDTAPADPEQVARKLQRLRLDLGLERDDWDDLTEEHRVAATLAVAILLAWLKRQGAA